MVESIAVFGLVLLTATLIWFRLRVSLIPPPEIVSFLIHPPAFTREERRDNINFEQFYAVISELLDSSSNQRFKTRPYVVLEAIFSAKHGTSLLVSAPVGKAEVVKNQLLELAPRIKVSEFQQTEQFKLLPGQSTKITYWRPGSKPVSNHYADSVVGIMAANLRGLKAGESVGWQVTLSPIKPSWFLKLVSNVSKLAFYVMKISINFILELSEHDPRLARQRSYNLRLKQNARATTDQSKHLLRVGIKSIIATKSVTRINTLTAAINAATKVNGLTVASKTSQTVNLLTFSQSSMPRRSFKVESSYLSRLFNLPEPGGRWEEDAQLSFSAELSAGANNNQQKVDVVLGVSGDHVVGLSKRERETHTLIIGGTGMGKSTLLGYSFIQDITNSKGAALIDPHGDLASNLLKYVPRHRVADVIYLDPSNIHYPVAINLMELPRGLSANELAIAKDFIAEAIISIFRKVFSDDDSGGHRIEYILRNAIYTAFTIPGATLLTLHMLLTNDVYRAGVVSHMSDDSLKDFWYGEYAKAGNYQRVKMISGVTAKLGRFQRSIAVSRLIDHAKSSINFEQLINERKILICNFAKGAIGEDSSALLGMIVLAKLQLAALRRSQQQVVKRVPFYLYVDEFELFNAPIFSQLISESRKFGMHLTLAEQTTAYQDDRESNILLANIGNIVSFRTAADVDNRRLLPPFAPYLSSADLANLEPYSFYLKSTGEQAKRPVSAQTIQLLGEGSTAVANRVLRSSHQHYSYPYLEKTVVVARDRRIPMVKR